MGREKIMARLSFREAAILVLLAKGLTNKEIARRQSVSSETVKTHVASVLNKLKAHNRAEAVAAASKAGLLKTETVTLPRVIIQSQGFDTASETIHEFMEPPPPTFSTGLFRQVEVASQLDISSETLLGMPALRRTTFASAGTAHPPACA